LHCTVLNHLRLQTIARTLSSRGSPSGATRQGRSFTRGTHRYSTVVKHNTNRPHVADVSLQFRLGGGNLSGCCLVSPGRCTCSTCPAMTQSAARWTSLAAAGKVGATGALVRSARTLHPGVVTKNQVLLELSLQHFCVVTFFLCVSSSMVDDPEVEVGRAYLHM
jgi:hypothetical protein